MYKRDEEGFVIRDHMGRKITHVYADTREQIHESKRICLEGTPNGGCWHQDTEEGSFDIIDVGPIQYSHVGFPTEALCGYRTHWRHAVILGKPRRPIKWRSREQIIQRC